jgi:urea carboxylase
MKSIRDDAPYVPSNVDFVAANNGLSGRDDVRAVLMEASYMVLGLGGADPSPVQTLFLI